MKVFVTGHRGYIGSSPGRPAQAGRPHRHRLRPQPLRGMQLGTRRSSPTGNSSRTSAQVEASDLDGCDCVMHLAAISNDPMGELNAQITFDVNRDASIRLAELAKRCRRAALPLRRELLGLRQGREARP